MAARSSDRKDRVGTASVGHTWSSSIQTMGVDSHWQQRLQRCPQFIRDTKPRRGAVVGRSLSVSFRRFWLLHCFFLSTGERALRRRGNPLLSHLNRLLSQGPFPSS